MPTASTGDRPSLPLTARDGSRRFRPDRWGALVTVGGAVLSLPLVAVLLRAGGESPAWESLVGNLLGGYIATTVGLVVLVVALALPLGVLPAWLVSTCDFPGRRLLSWMLVLPLALPTYVAAFVFYRLPEAAIPALVRIRTEHGADAFLTAEFALRFGLLALMLAAVLYPYLYLAARSAFSRQCRSQIESARLLGDGIAGAFFRVALPAARPALVAGGAFVAMEVANDYGAVHFFGVTTLSAGIFRTWFGSGDLVAALRLAALMMATMLVLLALERLLRGRAQYLTGSQATPPARRRLPAGKATLAVLVCLVPLAIGFLYPVGCLAHWAWLHVSAEGGFALPAGLRPVPALGLAAATTLFATVFAALVAYAARLRQTLPRRAAGGLLALGYAIPGAVVAVGVLSVTGFIDRLHLPLLPLIGGTLPALAFAYAARYFAIPLKLAEAGLEQIGRPVEEASRVLGAPPGRTFLAISLPLLRGPLIAAAILLFVDLIKELPLTLILRPAGFETLATTAFSLASEARLQACAVPSLLVIAAGVVPLFLLEKRLSPSRRHD
ncbi:MAG: iron ABC transporter permease [Verrucomicrobiales bacterium]|nr:iron ABC transporter permease [Verrucomicrobiales bacterium]